MGCNSSKLADDLPLPNRIRNEHNRAPRAASPVPSEHSFQYPEEHQMTPNSSQTFEALAKHASRASKASRAASKASRSASRAASRAASRDASTRGFRNRSGTSSGATAEGGLPPTSHSPESRRNRGHSFDRMGLNAFMEMHNQNRGEGVAMAGTWPPRDVPENKKGRKNWPYPSQVEMSKAKSGSKKLTKAFRKRHGHEDEHGYEASGTVERNGTSTGFEDIPLAEIRGQQVNSQAQANATTQVHTDTIATDWDRIASAVASPEK